MHGIMFPVACRLCVWCSIQDAGWKPLRMAAEKHAVSQACN